MNLHEYRDLLGRWIAAAPFCNSKLNQSQNKDLENGLADKHKVCDEWRRVNNLIEKPLKRDEWHVES